MHSETKTERKTKPKLHSPRKDLFSTIPMDGFLYRCSGSSLLPPLRHVLQGQRRSYLSAKKSQTGQDANRSDHEKFLLERHTYKNPRKSETRTECYCEDIVRVCEFHQLFSSRQRFVWRIRGLRSQMDCMVSASQHADVRLHGNA